MSRFVKKNWIHFAIWGGMLLYLLFAQDIYVRYFLRNGKPDKVNIELPTKSEKIKLHIDVFEPTVYDGQLNYSVVGWAYSADDPNMRPDDYERLLILISDDANYVFSVNTYPRPDVQKAFQSLEMELTDSGFRTLVSPDVIKPGTYQIGFVFYNHSNKTSQYAVTNKILIRTPNQLEITLPTQTQ